MTTRFPKLNLLDASSLDDVRSYTNGEAMPANIGPADTHTYQYISLEEIKHAPDWKHADFNYTVNYYGFRMDHVPIEIDIGVFGCSFTFGTGMPSDKMWHSILGKTRHQTVGNFGIPGTSAVTALELFMIVSKFIKMKKAVFLLPSFMRYQIAKKNPVTGAVTYLSTIPNHDSKLCQWHGLDTSQIYKILPDEHLYKDVKNSLYLAEHVAKMRNIEMYVSSWELDSYTFMTEMNFSHLKLLPRWYHPVEITNDTARDNRHPGFKLNQFFAEQIIPYIK